MKVRKWGITTICLVAMALAAQPQAEPSTATSDERVQAASLMEDGARLLGQRTSEALQSAVLAYQQALSIWQKVGDSGKQVEALLDLATAQFLLRRSEDARALLIQAVKVARTAGNRRDEATVLKSSALLYDSLGDEQKALDEAVHSRAIFQSLGDKDNEAQVLLMQAFIYRKLKDTPNAITSLEQSLPLFRASNNRQGEAQTLLGLAQLNSIGNQPEAFEKSVTYFTQALPLFQAMSDRFNEAYAWWGLGTANDRLGRTKQARDAYLNALPFFTDKKDDRAIARLLLSLGEDEEALGNLQKAVEYYEQALPLLASQGEGFNQGLLLSHLGRAQQKLGETSQTIDTYKAAITVWHSIEETASEASSYLMLGTALSAIHDWKGTMEADAAALKLAESIGDRSTQAAAIVAMAGIYSTLGDYQKSLDLSLRSIALLEGDQVPVRKASALMLAGDSYSALHNSNKALEYLSQSLVLNQNNPAGKAGVLTSMGEVYSDMGDQKKALELEQQALDILRPLDDPAGTNKVLNDLGLTYSAMGKMSQALTAFETSLASARSRNDLQQQSATLNNLARTHQTFGDTKQAEALYLESLALVRQVGDRYQEAATLSNLGMVYHALGDEQNAQNTLNQALTIRRELSDRHGEAIALNNLALVFSDTGEPQRALDCYEQTLSIFKSLGDSPELGTTFNNLGTIYRALGMSDRAQVYYRQALQIREQTGDDDGRAVTLNNLAVLEQGSGRPEEAREYYRQALQLADKLGNRIQQARLLSGLGLIDSELGDPRQALDQLQHSLEIARQTDDLDSQALALHNLGTVYEKLDDLPQALDRLRHALALWRQINSVEGQAKTLYVIAKVERKQGDPQAALSHVEESIRLSESLRRRLGSEDLRASLLAAAGSSYELEIAILMQLDQLHKGQGYDARALETSERARARSLLDLLTESRAHIRQGVDPQLLAQEESIKRSLNAKALQLRKLQSSEVDSADRERLNREIEELNSAYEEVEAQVRSKSPAYAALTQPQPLTLRDIQRELDPNTLLLEYALGTDRSYLWMVAPTSFHAYELPKRETIEEAARDFHERMPQIANPEGIAQAAAKLSAILLGPVASELKKNRLIIVSDGLVQALVPFSVLPAPSAPNSDLAESSPALLIADHQVVTEPSASAIAALRHEVSGRKMPAKAVAVLADPVFDPNDERLSSPSASRTGESAAQVHPSALPAVLESVTRGTSLQRLRKTREEANNILALTTPAQSLVKLDFDASKANAESPELADYRMVHFATHGVLDQAHPQLSGIVFSLYDRKGQGVDGFLRLNEIFNLRLPVELVVLSACQSGQGKLVGGEGVVGLTRGFMYAGAASMVVSLWKVDDAATAELMTRFYQKMLGDERMRPAAALRAAQLSMIATTRWKHPWYWAPFIVEGEWR